MAVLVVGGAGYIGSVTVRALQRAGREVVVFDDLSTGSREAVPDGVAFVQGSTHDPGLVERVVVQDGIDSVIHFAAKKSVAESMQQPGRYFSENIGGTNSLLEALVRAGVERLVFSSSAAVYGDAQTPPIREDGATVPESPYGESKLLVERMLSWYSRCHGLRSVSLRYFNAAGAAHDGSCGEDFAQATNLVPLIMRAALTESGPLEIFGTDYPTRDGTCIRDYIHVEDLADGHVAALQHLELGGSTAVLNLGTATGSTVREVVAAGEAAIGRSIPTVEAPRRAGDPVAAFADITRANEVLGWTPRRGLAEIMDSELRWRTSHPGGFAG